MSALLSIHFGGKASVGMAYKEAGRMILVPDTMHQRQEVQASPIGPQL